MNSLHLHGQLVQELGAIGLKASRPQRVNVAYLCQALAFSPNCHLSTLALGMPLRGQRESLIQRVRRLLKNKHLNPLGCYEPLVGHLFAHWPHREVNLVMDRTDLEDRWSILLLGAAYRKRVLPLAWHIMPFGSSSAQRQMALLEWVQPHLPSLEQVRVTFYGDCEFRAVSVQRVCQGYGWHWYIGLKSDVYFPPRWPVADLGPLGPETRRAARSAKGVPHPRASLWAGEPDSRLVRRPRQPPLLGLRSAS